MYNTICSRGCGGIGIRARLRGVFREEYEFKSRQPHAYCGRILTNLPALFCAERTKKFLFRHSEEYFVVIYSPYVLPL